MLRGLLDGILCFPFFDFKFHCQFQVWRRHFLSLGLRSFNVEWKKITPPPGSMVFMYLVREKRKEKLVEHVLTVSWQLSSASLWLLDQALNILGFFSKCSPQQHLKNPFCFWQVLVRARMCMCLCVCCACTHMHAYVPVSVEVTC